MSVTTSLGRKWYADDEKHVHLIVAIHGWIDCRILDLEHPEITLKKLIPDGMLPLV